jgi:hypothetical protein
VLTRARRYRTCKACEQEVEVLLSKSPVTSVLLNLNASYEAKEKIYLRKPWRPTPRCGHATRPFDAPCSSGTAEGTRTRW